MGNDVLWWKGAEWELIMEAWSSMHRYKGLEKVLQVRSVREMTELGVNMVCCGEVPGLRSVTGGESTCWEMWQVRSSKIGSWRSLAPRQGDLKLIS